MGQILYTKGFTLFLIAGLILLIALVGSIVLTLQTRHDVKKQSVGQQRSRNADNSVFLVDIDPAVGGVNKGQNESNISLFYFILMLETRFRSLLVKNGKNPDKILKDMYKSLKKSGIRNPEGVLGLVVDKLSLPLETKKRRRGRQ